MKEPDCHFVLSLDILIFGVILNAEINFSYHKDFMFLNGSGSFFIIELSVNILLGHIFLCP